MQIGRSVDSSAEQIRLGFPIGMNWFGNWQTATESLKAVYRTRCEIGKAQDSIAVEI